MSQALQFALLGLGAGAIYALLAHGVVLIYRGTGILNFAQGAFAMVGAYVFVELRDERSVDVWPAVFLSVAVVALLGAATYVGIMRPLRTASPLARLIATLGIVIVLEAAVILRWGTGLAVVQSILPQDVVRPFGEVVIGVDRLVLVAIGAVVTIGLYLVFRYTMVGLATRAAAENHLAVATLGWSPDTIGVVNWAAGGALAGIGGILVAPLTGLNAGNLTVTVVAATAAALVGGFSSFPLTFAGGMLLGVSQSLAARYVSQQGIAQAIPFLVIVAVLVMRGRALPLRSHLTSSLPQLGTGRRNVPALVACIVAVPLVLGVLGNEWVDGIAVTLVTAIVLLAVVVITGYTGQLSLAHYAVAGMGALGTGRLVASAGWPFEAALVVGVALAVVIGLLFALPALRTRGVNLAVVTLGLGMAVEQVVFNNVDLSGGADGTPVGPQTFFGVDIDPIAHPYRYAVLAFGFFVIAALAVANVRRSRAGRRLIAVRTNERAAAALGVNVLEAKLYGFALSAAIAGLGGVLIGFRSHVVVYGFFNPFHSIMAVALATIGGVGFVIGPLFGATLAPGGFGSVVGNQFASVSEYIPLIGGIALLAFLLHDPDGMASGNIRMARAVVGGLRRSRPRVPDEPAPTEPPAPPAEVVRVRPQELVVEGVRVTYGGVVAVADASFRVGAGEVLGLIGPNGAGKTTIIDAVTGFAPLAAGRIVLDGRPLDGLGAHRRAALGLTRSFQSLELFEDLTVRENVLAAADDRDRAAYIAGLVRPGSPALPPAAASVVEAFHLGDELDIPVRELSHGHRRLTAIARAVVSRPSVLLLDEPAAGLSEAESGELARLVTDLAERWGMGVVLVEHDMSFVMTVCTKLVVLDFGHVIAAGDPVAVCEDPAVVAAYLGASFDAARREAERADLS